MSNEEIFNLCWIVGFATIIIGFTLYGCVKQWAPSKGVKANTMNAKSVKKNKKKNKKKNSAKISSQTLRSTGYYSLLDNCGASGNL